MQFGYYQQPWYQPHEQSARYHVPPTSTAVSGPSSHLSQPSSAISNEESIELDEEKPFMKKMTPTEFQQKMNFFSMILDNYSFSFYERDQLMTLKVRCI